MLRLETDLEGLMLFELDAFPDNRGSFMELYRAPRYHDLGLNVSFVQDNLSVSKQGVLRGMHSQNPNAQGKLISVIKGEIYDVAVDARPDSPTFAQWRGFTLSDQNHRQLYIPEGFLHGFYVVSEEAYVHYKVTAPHDSKGDCSVRWDDLDLAIEWPTREPILSAKDASAPFFADVQDRLRL